MKRIITAAILAISLSLNAQTVTNTPPVIASPVFEAFNFLSTPASNWMFAAYGIQTEKDGNGVGIGALYKVSENFGAVLRLDRFGGDTFMPSGNFQVQVPVTIMGKVTVTPFAFTGIATPINEDNSRDGVIGIFGIGAAIRTPEVIKSKSRFLPDAVVYDVEKWTSYEGSQHRLGLLWKF